MRSVAGGNGLGCQLGCCWLIDERLGDVLAREVGVDAEGSYWCRVERAVSLSVCLCVQV